MSRDTFVYRLFDDRGDLLYVGITSNLKRRRAQHVRDKWWWSQVARTSIQGPFERRVAAEREVAAIATERPQHNKLLYWNRQGEVAPNAAAADALAVYDEVVHLVPPLPSAAPSGDPLRDYLENARDEAVARAAHSMRRPDQMFEHLYRAVECQKGLDLLDDIASETALRPA